MLAGAVRKGEVLNTSVTYVSCGRKGSQYEKYKAHPQSLKPTVVTAVYNINSGPDKTP
jgi:hypothetical protein